MNPSLDINSISDSGNKLLYILLQVAGVGGAIVRFCKIKFSSFGTGIVVWINNKISTTYWISEGILNKLENESFHLENVDEVYGTSLEALSKIKKLYYSLEKSNFLNNPKTQELVEDTLSNFYKIESIVRQKALINSSVPEDKHLIEVATKLSNNILRVA